MSGRASVNDPALRGSFHEAEVGQDSGMTDAQMRWLILGLLFLAWCAARALLHWWPGLLG